jgi:hypothetical protein
MIATAMARINEIAVAAGMQPIGSQVVVVNDSGVTNTIAYPPAFRPFQEALAIPPAVDLYHKVMTHLSKQTASPDIIRAELQRNTTALREVVPSETKRKYDNLLVMLGRLLTVSPQERSALVKELAKIAVEIDTTLIKERCPGISIHQEALRLTAELDALQARLNAATAATATAERNRNAARGNAESARQQLAAKQISSSQKSAESEQKTAAIEAANAALEAMRDQLATVTEADTAKQEQITGLGQRVAQLTAQVASITGERDTFRRERNTAIGERDERNATIGRQTTQLQRQQQQLQESHDQAVEAVTALERELAAAREEGGLSAGRIREIEAALAAAQEAAQASAQERNAMRIAGGVQRTALTRNLQAAREATAQLQQELDAARAAPVPNPQEIAAAGAQKNTQIRDLQAQLAAAQGVPGNAQRIADLTAQLAGVTANRERLQQDLASRQGRSQLDKMAAESAAAASARTQSELERAYIQVQELQRKQMTPAIEQQLKQTQLEALKLQAQLRDERLLVSKLRAAATAKKGSLSEANILEVSQKHRAAVEKKATEDAAAAQAQVIAKRGAVFAAAAQRRAANVATGKAAAGGGGGQAAAESQTAATAPSSSGQVATPRGWSLGGLFSRKSATSATGGSDQAAAPKPSLAEGGGGGTVINPFPVAGGGGGIQKPPQRLVVNPNVGVPVAGRGASVFRKPGELNRVALRPTFAGGRPAAMGSGGDPQANSKKKQEQINLGILRRLPAGPAIEVERIDGESEASYINRKIGAGFDTISNLSEDALKKLPPVGSQKRTKLFINYSDDEYRQVIQKVEEFNQEVAEKLAKMGRPSFNFNMIGGGTRRNRKQKKSKKTRRR